MPAAAAAAGRAGTAAQLLPLAVELAADADEAVRQVVALQLAPLGECPSLQGFRQCGAKGAGLRFFYTMSGCTGPSPACTSTGVLTQSNRVFAYTQQH